MIDETIKEYYELQKKKEAIEDDMKALKEEIVALMLNDNENKKTTEDGITASITTKETIKYNDEAGMIQYLKANGLEKYITEKVSSSINKELKTSKTLNESLNGMFTKSTSYSLTVKGE